jgi:hypothetical protein
VSPNRVEGVAAPPYTQTGAPAAAFTHRIRPSRPAAPAASESMDGMADFGKDNRQEAANPTFAQLKCLR